MRKDSRASRSLKRILSGGVVLALASLGLFALPTPAFAAGETTVSVSGSVLTATASPGIKNSITVGNASKSGGSGVSIKDTGPAGDGVTLVANPDCVKATPDEVRCDLGTITSVVVNGDDVGDFFFLLNSSLATRTINGDAGDDTFTGGSGADIMNGGSGDDTMTGGGAGDTFNGGTGGEVDGDLVNYGSALSVVTVTMGDGVANDGRDTSGSIGNQSEGDNVASDVENVDGSDFADDITGNALNNVLRGGPGNDVLHGDTANDTLIGEGGNDGLFGDAGSFDRASYALEGSKVTVTVDDVANDGELGETDNVHTDIEIVIGGTAGDSLTGGAGSQTLQGGSGNDILNGDAGTDVLIGNGGTDTASYLGRAAAVTITLDGIANDGASGENDDVRPDIENATGGDAGDNITGNSGVNRLSGGGGGADQLHGAGGNDTLVGNIDGAVDTYDGGGGTDLLTFSSEAAGVVIEADGSGAGNTEGEIAETTVENLTGGTGNDTLTGNGSRNVINGGFGNDVLNGDPVCPVLTPCPSNDSLNGNQGDDTLRGRDGSDTLNGGTGPGVDPILGAFTDADVLDGGPGIDSVSYSTRTANLSLTLDGTANDGAAGEGDDVQTDTEKITGGSGDDTITGDSSKETLTGGSGNDTINGAGGNDIINGNGGNDILTGGGGQDTLSGATGNDVFHTADGLKDSINCGDGTDNVADTDGVDTKTSNCFP